MERVEGRVYLHSIVPGIAQSITTSPRARSSLDLKPDCSSRIIKAQVPVVLPTCPTQWPIYKSTTDVVIDCVTSTHEEQDRVTIPARAGNSREAESNIDPSIHLPNRRAELARISKLTFGNQCCDSGDCNSAISRNCRSAKSIADANDQCPSLKVSTPESVMSVRVMP